jgi:hypothetical protein
MLEMGLEGIVPSEESLKTRRMAGDTAILEPCDGEGRGK